MMTYTADLQRCDLDNAGQARTPATTCLMLFMLNVKTWIGIAPTCILTKRRTPEAFYVYV